MNEEIEAGPVYDSLDLQKHILTPEFPGVYKETINKDIVLSNIRRPQDFEEIDGKLSRATYLNGIKQRILVGYTLYYKDGNRQTVPITDKAQIVEIVLKNPNIQSINEEYEEQEIYKKSCHNMKSRAYTRSAVTRGMEGFATKQLNTQTSEQKKFLKDETERSRWTGKPKSGNWREYEQNRW